MELKIDITKKALALTAAIESGLCPEIEGGWDDTKFNIFWEKYEKYLAEYFEEKTGKRNKKSKKR